MVRTQSDTLPPGSRQSHQALNTIAEVFAAGQVLHVLPEVGALDPSSGVQCTDERQPACRRAHFTARRAAYAGRSSAGGCTANSEAGAAAGMAALAARCACEVTLAAVLAHEGPERME